MKIFLSPAKRLNENPTTKWNAQSVPRFLEHSNKVMETLSQKSPQDLKSLMKISDELAELNYERNQKWNDSPKETENYHAGLMFDGEVYRGFRESEFSKDDFSYLQENVFILSGLYGILSPTDLVMPYRLEMGTKLPVEGSKNLHEFWRPTLTEFVNNQLKDSEILLDLASTEYISALNKKALKGNWIDVKFKDYKDGKLKQIMVYMKKARGEMAHYCTENKVQTIEELKKFNRMGYALDGNLSDDKTLVFTR